VDHGGQRRAAALEAPRPETPTNDGELRKQSLKIGVGTRKLKNPADSGMLLSDGEQVASPLDDLAAIPEGDPVHCSRCGAR
jgi:hypothetical protein